jgi:hypothetical protein
MKIETGESIILILHSPREKLFGVLHEINASGIFLRGIDLNYFDEWTRAIANGEQYLPMQDYFLPMWRVERLTRDESAAGLLSLTEQFSQRTGLYISHF